VNADQKSVYYPACGGSPTSFTVYATVDDPSGVRQVTLSRSYSTASGKWLQQAMDSKDGRNFVATVDINKEAYGFLKGGDGGINLRVTATDGVGNQSNQGGPSLKVQFCPR
jgi:hypothetical protein